MTTLAARFKTTLGERVSAVRGSSRPTDSAVCLVASDTGLDRELEKILARHQTDGRKTAPVLELNPSHPLINALAEKAATGAGADALDDAAHLLFGEARILDGELPDDPSGYAVRIARLLQLRLG